MYQTGSDQISPVWHYADAVADLLQDISSNKTPVSVSESWHNWPMPFHLVRLASQHKNRLNRGQGLGWRFSSATLRIANDTVTSQSCCLIVQQ